VDELKSCQTYRTGNPNFSGRTRVRSQEKFGRIVDSRMPEGIKDFMHPTMLYKLGL
jgi:hypothetical protein